jgi:hypothetical protein
VINRSVSRRQVLAAGALFLPGSKTEVSIKGEQFLINGVPTYKGRNFEGHRIEGLLMNSRMIQGVFDDLNPETASRWKYPDTGKWSAERNNREYVAAMPSWRRHGLLAFTIGIQGGSPEGYSKAQPWNNNGYGEDGSLRPEFFKRLERILKRADELGMVAIVNYFYFGQDERLKDTAAVERAAIETTKWILDRGYRHVLVDLVNESDNRSYQQPAMQAANVHELIEEGEGRQGGWTAVVDEHQLQWRPDSRGQGRCRVGLRARSRQWRHGPESDHGDGGHGSQASVVAADADRV